MSRDAATLLDIEHALTHAVQFVADTPDLDTFAADAKTRSAVLHQLMVLGEAVKRLSTEVREANPHLPWKQMAGLRDLLIHAYDHVDASRVWYIVQDDLPDTLRHIRALRAGPSAGV